MAPFHDDVTKAGSILVSIDDVGTFYFVLRYFFAVF